MLKKAPRSSSRSRSRGRGTRSNRANTQPAPLPDYLKDPNYKSPYAKNNSGLATINDDQQQGGNNNNNNNDLISFGNNNNNNNQNNNLGGGKQSGHQLKKSTDDLLDLFGMSASSANSTDSNNGNGNNLAASNDFMNPFASSVPNQLPSQSQQQPRAHAYSAVNTNSNNMFGDDFFGSNNNNNNSNDPFSSASNKNTNNNNSNNNSNNNNNNNNGNTTNNDSNTKSKSKSKSKKSKKPKNSAYSSSAQSNGSEEDDEKDGYRKSPRPEHPPPKPKAKTRKNRAQTDASALNSPTKNAPDPPKKVKTKSIDVLPLLHTGVKANKFKFGQNKSKVRTFYLTKDNQWFCWEPVGGPLQAKPNRKKIDPTRSIFIRSIREVKKNSSAMVQDLNFIPAQHKALTISIVYDLKGSEKKVNLMAYEPFHHVLVFEAIHKLSVMGQNINRDLGNVFELYVDFEKEILPKHLRPQRFKWEPLGQQDIESAQKEKEDGSNGNSALETIDSFDPTQERRNRLKSF